MDDPWGSPWTSSNDDFASFVSAPTADTAGPKPPQPAVLASVSLNGSNNNSNSNSSNNAPTLSFSSLEPSPWADDDDNFGDWTAADAGGGGGGGLLGTTTLGGSSAAGALGWADAFDDNRLSPRPKQMALQARSPSSTDAWPSSIARPPGALTTRSRTGSMRSRASSTRSLASSDPWGARDELRDDLGEPKLKEKAEERGGESHHGKNKSNDNDNDDDDAGSFASFEEAHTATPPKETEEPTATAATQPVLQDTSRPSSDGYGTETESRTESHVDLDQDHDDEGRHEDLDDPAVHDSPTTSVEDADRDEKDDEGHDEGHDEDHDDDDDDDDAERDLEIENRQDSKAKRPALRRLPSSSVQPAPKVQHLVELFDGLAKRPVSASGSGSVPGSRSASATRSISAARSVSAARSASATRSISMERPSPTQSIERPSRQLSLKDLPENDANDSKEPHQDDSKVAQPSVSPTAATAAIEPGPEPTTETVENVEPQVPGTPREAAATQLGTTHTHARQPSHGEEAAHATTTPVASVDSLLALYAKQGPYTVDTPAIDELFSSFPTQPTAPRPEDADLDAFVPDGYILDDSFTSTSERRVWYRIARLGSSRKHNAGGSGDSALEANYRPITWATSTVLPDTVKIVRRWMEEDSLSGKPTLGGGRLFHAGGAAGMRGVNMFGWDSAAEPVKLDEVFKSRRRLTAASSSSDATDKANNKANNKPHAHTRTQSEAQPAPSAAASAFGWGSGDGRAVPKKEAPARHSVHFGTPAPLGSFGNVGGDGGTNVWAAAAAPEKSRAVPAAATMPVKPASPLRTSFSLDAGSVPRLGSLPPPPKLVPRHSPLSINTVVAAEDADTNEADDDDDDEWGEMVMSPTAGTSSLAPTQPPPVVPTLAPSPVAQALPPIIGAPIVAQTSAAAVDFSAVESILGNLPDLSYMSR